jgi:outer membrane protein assembly factor BamC
LSLILPVPALRLTVVALTAMLAAACTSTDPLFSSGTPEYRSAQVKTRPLEVPPDLTQLAREGRYQAQGGVVSAAAAASAPASPVVARSTPTALTQTSVAPGKVGDIRIERQGQQRWLVVPQTPEQLWPQLRDFWQKNGFTLALDNPQTGLMETNWSENRAKLPRDAVRNAIGSLLGNAYDTGERDLFRTRVERTEGGSEVFISHRGVWEIPIDATRGGTTWRARPSDPELEAEFLARLMMALGGSGQEAPRGAQTVAATPAIAAAVAAAPEPPARARVLPDAGGTSLEVDEPFDRAWRRVGLALDRGGFTVEDRDRAQGLYFVRYVDPTTAGQEEPNFFSRMFSGGKDPQTPVRYRIALKGNGPKTTLSVLTSAGAPDAGENGKRIVAQLVNELK